MRGEALGPQGRQGLVEIQPRNHKFIRTYALSQTPMNRLQSSFAAERC